MRIDKFFGLAALIAILILASMLYIDFGINKGESVRQQAEDEESKDVLSQDATNKQEATTGTQDFSTSSGNVTVCIDPAKGGTDKGTSGFGYDEKTVNLEIATKVSEFLKASNIKVVMTRNSDESVTDERRAAICNEAKANLCVSLRMNSYSEELSVSGAEIWIHEKGPAEAKAASEAILSSMNKDLGIKNRGVKTGSQSSPKENYNINAKCKCTSLVLNMGFITNKTDMDTITGKKDATAKAIADGIINYLKQAGLY